MQYYGLITDLGDLLRANIPDENIMGRALNELDNIEQCWNRELNEAVSHELRPIEYKLGKAEEELIYLRRWKQEKDKYEVRNMGIGTIEFYTENLKLKHQLDDFLETILL